LITEMSSRTVHTTSSLALVLVISSISSYCIHWIICNWSQEFRYRSQGAFTQPEWNRAAVCVFSSIPKSHVKMMIT
jgi:hypothetical protein